jgi:RimJ/RimL family protein N-acetyltransferase
LAEKVYVKGEKTVLREKRVEDAPGDYSWRTDEELASLDATRPLNMSYEDFLRYSKEEISFVSPLSKRLAIDTLDGKHIGNCMYYDIDVKGGEAELGVMIGDRDYWGKGYGTDSVASLLGYIFTATSLDRVYLHTLDWNERAQRSFSKTGFREVKRVRRSGQNFIRMEVLRSDWEARADSKHTA